MHASLRPSLPVNGCTCAAGDGPTRDLTSPDRALPTKSTHWATPSPGHVAVIVAAACRLSPVAIPTTVTLWMPKRNIASHLFPSSSPAVPDSFALTSASQRSFAFQKMLRELYGYVPNAACGSPRRPSAPSTVPKSLTAAISRQINRLIEMDFTSVSCYCRVPCKEGQCSNAFSHPTTPLPSIGQCHENCRCTLQDRSAHIDNTYLSSASPCK
jgi:hypothetical protein